MNCRSKINMRYGVLPVAVYTKPYHCGGNCIFCPSTQGIPKSYLPNQDTLTAKRLSFDPAKQFKWKVKFLPKPLRQEEYPFEIIIIGGSFSSLAKEYRKWFVTKLYSAINSKNDAEAEHSKNNACQGRCSVLTVESRPDQITNEECKFLRELGVTKVELGVQHTNNEILDAVCRGHQQTHIIEATKLLKNHGFKIGYHVMLGLPGATINDDILMLGETLWFPQYHPDYLKIYPCTLLKDEKFQPKLHLLYRSKRWFPPSDEYCQVCLATLSKAIPKYVRVSRIQRQFSNNDILDSPKRGLRTRLLSKLNDLRSREAGTRLTSTVFDFNRLSILFNKSGADLYIEVVEKDNDILLAIARITITSKETCFLRELKVFGETNPVGLKGQIQGRGLGTYLLFVLEHHVSMMNVKNIYVNASIGAKSFFIQNGYFTTHKKILIKKIQQRSFNNFMHRTGEHAHFSEVTPAWLSRSRLAGKATASR